jgi:hypothetical protein
VILYYTPFLEEVMFISFRSIFVFFIKDIVDCTDDELYTSEYDDANQVIADATTNTPPFRQIPRVNLPPSNHMDHYGSASSSGSSSSSRSYSHSNSSSQAYMQMTAVSTSYIPPFHQIPRVNFPPSKNVINHHGSVSYGSSTAYTSGSSNGNWSYNHSVSDSHAFTQVEHLFEAPSNVRTQVIRQLILLFVMCPEIRL